MAMMAIRGIYERHEVVSLNHGIGFNTAAIELLLPTYGEALGLKGKICPALGAQPAPDADPGDRDRLGRERALLRRRGRHGGLHRRAARRVLHRPRRLAALQPGLVPAGRPVRGRHVHRLHAADRRATPTRRQSPPAGSPASAARPTWGTTRAAAGTPRRPGSASTPKPTAPISRGRKLVVQMAETFQAGGVPTFVETLDAVAVGRAAGMPIAPVMIYGDDVTHVVTEEGIAYLYLAATSRSAARPSRRLPGSRPLGRCATTPAAPGLRRARSDCVSRGSRRRPADANRSLLAARSIEDLVDLVRRALRAAGPFPELVTCCTTSLRPISAGRASGWCAAIGMHARSAAAGRPRGNQPDRGGGAHAEAGLVDARDSGAHRDIDLPLMRHSAHALRPTFLALAAPRRNAPKRSLARRARPDRARGERAMLDATGGINTHRGAHLGPRPAGGGGCRAGAEAGRRAVRHGRGDRSASGPSSARTASNGSSA